VEVFKIGRRTIAERFIVIVNLGLSGLLPVLTRPCLADLPPLAVWGGRAAPRDW